MSEGEHPYVERLETEKTETPPPMSAEWCQGYREGLDDARTGFDELQEVRKIACALIGSGIPAASREVSYVDHVADMAWKVWRAIKAGQEDRKP